MSFFDKFKKKENNPFDSSLDKSQDPFTNTQNNSLPQDPFANTEDNSLPKETYSDPFSHDIFNENSTQQYPTQQPQFPGNQQPAYPNTPQYHEDVAPSRDVELILAKLDAIKAELDSVHQRVRKLESAHDAKHPQQKYW